MEVCLKTSLATLVLTAMALAPVPALAEPLKVVASFSIIADFAQQVGGDRIELTTLVGPDGDTHVYEPKPADAVAMSKADVILVNGLALEGFLDRLVDASGTDAPVIALSDGIDVIANGEDDDDEHHDDESEAHDDDDHDHHDGDDHDDHDEDGDHDHEEAGHHHHGAYDPHAWLSVPNAEIYVGNIRDAFCAVDAEGCPVYEANAADYIDELAALDTEIHKELDRIPADKRVIITSHAAFAYFGREYGLTFLSPQGLSTEAEPSAADVAALIRQIRDDGATALFSERIADPRVIEQIADETDVAVNGDLYTGALSSADGPASTYIDMMRFDANAIGAATLGD